MGNKIKILLIDDNPELRNYINRLDEFINHNSGNMLIPYVWNDSPDGTDDDSNLNKRMDLLDVAFEVKWLKSPKDIKNYLSLTKFITRNFGKSALNKYGYVPDLIIFDYSLTQGMNDVTEYPDDIAEYIDPNRAMVNFLASKGITFPIENRNVSHSIPRDQDTLGLFLSALIIEVFAGEYPCVGVPITFFKDNLAGKDAQVFEWVVNEYYDKVLTWKGKGNKRWYEIVDFSLPLYREKILAQIRQNQVWINPEQLFDLLNWKFISSEENRKAISTFSFHSKYGERTIEIEHLFIDCDPFQIVPAPKALLEQFPTTTITDRQSKIYEFFNDIALAFVNLANIGIGITQIIDAKKIADTIWGEYLAKFESRVDLSELSSRQGNLYPEERGLLVKLLRDFSVKGNTIAKENEVSILKYKKSHDAQTIRLAILYIVSQASIRLARISSKSGKKVQYRDLDEQEIFYLLNPVINTARGHNLKLPMHFPNFSQIREVLDDFNLSITRLLKNTVPRPERATFSDLTWVSTGEKIIVRSFFNEDESILPLWLK